MVPEILPYNVAVQQRNPSRLLPGPMVSMWSWRCHTILGSYGDDILLRETSDVEEIDALRGDKRTDVRDPYELVLGTSCMEISLAPISPIES